MIFVLAQVVDAQTGILLDVPSIGHWIGVANGKIWKEIVKEIKPEIEYVKLQIEFMPKIIAEVDDPFKVFGGDPVDVLQQIAATVDNLSRVVSGGRAFIRESERPLLPVVAREKLAAVPIHPLDKDTLARQLKMEGMVDAAAGGMDETPDPQGGTHHGPGPHKDPGHHTDRK
jgi:hypothetical protein